MPALLLGENAQKSHILHIKHLKMSKNAKLNFGRESVTEVKNVFFLSKILSLQVKRVVSVEKVGKIGTKPLKTRF